MVKKNTSRPHFISQLTSREKENYSLYRDFINPSLVKLMGLAGFARRYRTAHSGIMTDVNGTSCRDFLSGYGSLNLGHNHPVVKGALRAVLDLDLPSFSQVELGLAPGLAAEKLAGVLPSGLDKVYFCSSGSEAVDAALKLARAATGRKNIVCCDGAFHGNTLSVLGLTDNPGRRDRFRPLVPGTVRVPFNDLEALEQALRKKEVAAFIVEPVLGEGGAVVPADGYLAGARELCDRYGTLLVFDEVQTGLGRTGKMFACEHWGVTPDAIALAKSLGGGLMPVGAMATRADIFKKAYGSMAQCLDHKNTFGGGPLAMAAVLATLQVLADEKLAEKAADEGSYFRARLESLADKHSQIRKVRGLGFMLGIQFSGIPGKTLKKLIPAGGGLSLAELYTQYVVLRLLKKHNIITQVCANDFTVMKVMPPLITVRKDLDAFVAALDETLSSAGQVKAVLAMGKALAEGGKL